MKRQDALFHPVISRTSALTLPLLFQEIYELPFCFSMEDYIQLETYQVFMHDVALIDFSQIIAILSQIAKNYYPSSELLASHLLPKIVSSH